MNFESEGVAVTQDELARCLAEGRKLRPPRRRLVRAARSAEGPRGARSARPRSSRPAAATAASSRSRRRGASQELLAQVGPRERLATTRRSSSRSSATSTRSRARKKPRNLKAHAPPVPGAGLPLALVPPRDRLGRRPRRRHGSRQDGADDRAPPRGEERGREDRGQAKALQGAHRRADERRHELAARDRQVRAVAHATRSGTAPSARSGSDELEDADVVVTSYALLRRDEELLAKLDCATSSSTRRSTSRTRCRATARAAKRLKCRPAPRAHRHADRESPVARSGRSSTSCRPGLLGPLEKFEERYSRPIDGGDQKAAAAPPRDDPPLHPAPHQVRGREGSAREDRDRPVLRAHRRAGGALRGGAQGGARAGHGRGRAPRARARASIQILAGPHAAPSGGVRSAPARPAARVQRRGLGQARRAARARRRRRSRAGTRCSSSASS